MDVTGQRASPVKPALTFRSANATNRTSNTRPRGAGGRTSRPRRWRARPRPAPGRAGPWASYHSSAENGPSRTSIDHRARTRSPKDTPRASADLGVQMARTGGQVWHSHSHEPGVSSHRYFRRHRPSHGRVLAERGVEVIGVARNADRGRAAVQKIRDRTPAARIEVMIADLSQLDEVRRLAEEVRFLYDHLDVLLNNAGVAVYRRETTADGYERTFATNHLAPYLLTRLLVDRLEAADARPARVVCLSSEAHRQARSIPWNDLQSEQSYNGFRAYNLSKLANVLFARALSDRLDPAALRQRGHPGSSRPDCIVTRPCRPERDHAMFRRLQGSAGGRRRDAGVGGDRPRGGRGHRRYSRSAGWPESILSSTTSPRSSHCTSAPHSAVSTVTPASAGRVRCVGGSEDQAG